MKCIYMYECIRERYTVMAFTGMCILLVQFRILKIGWRQSIKFKHIMQFIFRDLGVRWNECNFDILKGEEFTSDPKLLVAPFNMY